MTNITQLLLLLQLTSTWALNCTNTAVLVLVDGFSKTKIDTELLAVTAASEPGMQYWFLKLHGSDRHFFELSHAQSIMNMNGVTETVTVNVVAPWRNESGCYFFPCYGKLDDARLCRPENNTRAGRDILKEEMIIDEFMSRKLLAVLISQMSNQTCFPYLGPEGPKPVQLLPNVTPDEYHARVLAPACTDMRQVPARKVQTRKVHVGNNSASLRRNTIYDKHLPATVALTVLYFVVAVIVMIICVVWSRYNPDPNGYVEMVLDDRGEQP